MNDRHYAHPASSTPLIRAGIVLIALVAITTPALAGPDDPPADLVGLTSGASPDSSKIKSGADQVRSKEASRQNPLACAIIDFEGVGHFQPVGRIPGDVNVTFGSSWVGVVDADANSSADGNFANEPSPSTVATYIDSNTPINFSRGVQFIEVFYSAAQSSLPLTLTAFSGTGGGGQEVDSTTGNVLGTFPEGAPCEGDPTGQFCLWSVLTLTSSQSNIRSIVLEGATGNFFAFDDMTFCTEPPVVINVPTEEKAIVPATVRPENPRTIYADDGRKAVIWQQNGAGGTIICIQFFDANDNPLTNPLIVNQSQGMNQTPSGAFDENGNLFIFWTLEDADALVDPTGRIVSGASQGSSVLGRRFSPLNGGTPIGGEIAVSNAQSGQSEMPDSAADRDGDTVVTWNDGGRVKARRFNKQGNAQGGTFEVNSANNGRGASTAISASGDFTVAWAETSGNAQGIKFRQYNENGSPKDSAKFVRRLDGATNPAIAIDDAGRFTIVWEEDGPSGRDIIGQRYSAAGTRIGDRFQANANVPGDQTRPKIDINSQGDFAVVWESTDLPATSAATFAGGSILGRTFNQQGQPNQTEVVIAESEAGNDPERPDVTINDEDDLTVVYGRRSGNGTSQGIFRKEVSVTAAPGSCTSDSTNLCAAASEFQVSVLWEDPATGGVSSGQATSLTSDTGFFTFFDPDNVEVVVKVLDACAFNNRYWVFATGLTNLEVTIRVDDVISGQSVTYFNPANTAFQAIQDTGAFRTCNAGDRSTGTTQRLLTDAQVDELGGMLAAGLADVARTDSARQLQKSVVCDDDTLCLNGTRFEVEASFRTADGRSGQGQQQAITDNTGLFTFFDPDNVELVIKVLDACVLNNRYWVFAAGLTNVRVELTVTDTVRNRTKEYLNRQGQAFAPVQDTNAFATCP